MRVMAHIPLRPVSPVAEETRDDDNNIIHIHCTVPDDALKECADRIIVVVHTCVATCRERTKKKTRSYNIIIF
jgi:hypothetical protein